MSITSISISHPASSNPIYLMYSNIRLVATYIFFYIPLPMTHTWISWLLYGLLASSTASELCESIAMPHGSCTLHAVTASADFNILLWISYTSRQSVPKFSGLINTNNLHNVKNSPQSIYTSWMHLCTHYICYMENTYTVNIERQSTKWMVHGLYPLSNPSHKLHAAPNKTKFWIMGSTSTFNSKSMCTYDSSHWIDKSCLGQYLLACIAPLCIPVDHTLKMIIPQS